MFHVKQAAGQAVFFPAQRRWIKVEHRWRLAHPVSADARRRRRA
jgi:hypothetical protein